MSGATALALSVALPGGAAAQGLDYGSLGTMFTNPAFTNSFASMMDPAAMANWMQVMANPAMMEAMMSQHPPHRATV